MAALEAHNVEVAFGGVRALDDVSVSAMRGQVTGLIGPNGAGKTTLLGVLSGLVRPRRGTVTIGGRDVTGSGPSQRARLGMSRTFQRIELWESMTVAQNVRTAADLAARWLHGYDAAQACESALDLVGIDKRLRDSFISELSTGHARQVELARAVAQQPRTLLLDEPTAGLDKKEISRTIEVLQRLSNDGMTIYIVEHHIEVVLATCSWVSVLEFGRVIAAGSPDDVRNDEAVKVAYLGTRHAK